MSDKSIKSIKEEALNNIAAPVIRNGKILYDLAAEDRCKVEVKEDIIFAMKDSRGVFSIGLTTILRALMIAEENYLIPEIPREWKYEVINRYLQ